MKEEGGELEAGVRTALDDEDAWARSGHFTFFHKLVGIVVKFSETFDFSKEKILWKFLNLDFFLNFDYLS